MFNAHVIPGFWQQKLTHTHSHCSTSISTNAMKGFFPINPPSQMPRTKLLRAFFLLLSSAFDAIKLIWKPWLARVPPRMCVGFGGEWFMRKVFSSNKAYREKCFWITFISPFKCVLYLPAPERLREHNEGRRRRSINNASAGMFKVSRFA